MALARTARRTDPYSHAAESLESRVLLASYFVSPGGSDANAGTAAQPWLTLQHAADAVAAGDDVTVRAGTYAGFALETSGTPTSRITFSGEAGVMISRRNVGTADGINLEGASFVTVQGFRVDNTTGTITRAGIRSVSNDGVVIRNNVCDRNGRWGIFTAFSENVLVEGNETSRSVVEHGIYVSNSADNPVVRGIRSWGNNACGLHFNGDVSMGGDGVISNALIENNVIYDNGPGGGSSINCDGVSGSRIVNNLIYDAHASGISLYRIDAGAGANNNVVANNTVLVASDGRWALNIQDGSTGNRVYNNVFHNAASSRGSITISADSLPGFVSNYNACDGKFTVNGGSVLTLSQWRTQTGQDAYSVVATPEQLFVNAAANDYHLAATSPVVDAGTSTQAPSTDRDGAARPQGAGFDIGAFEYASGSPIGGGGGGTAAVSADPWTPGASALVIQGTSGDDTILVTLSGRRKDLLVTINGTPSGPFARRSVERIALHGLAGNDRLELHPRITHAAFLDGGDGNDILIGGARHDMLLGAAGDDSLSGGRGNDVLLAGAGADNLDGGVGGDLLLASDAPFGADNACAVRLFDAWRTGRYAAKVSALRGGVAGVGPLNSTTFPGDGAPDILVGGGGVDWLFPAAEDTLGDRLVREQLN
jgi:Ca2+-binding RTX toxin-like protein